jgi:hypothetical protein
VSIHAVYASIAEQVCVPPQQVTLPADEEQVPLATVQVSVPPVHVAVQVSVADASRSPPFKVDNVTSPTIPETKSSLSMVSRLSDYQCLAIIVIA